VTGTDTEVGKTYVSRLILQELREQGVNAVGYKPVSSGDRTDAEQLAEVCGIEDLELINPYHFETPVAPMVAGLIHAQEVDPEVLTSRFEQLSRDYDYVVIEGAGGWRTPYLRGQGIGNIFKAYNLPAVLVVGNKLGAINHSVLSYEVLKADGVSNVSMVLNNLQDELDNATISNGGIIESMLKTEFVENVIQGQTYLDLEKFTCF